MRTNYKHLKCSICGLYAGFFKQHTNRDDGYGICPECAFEQSQINSESSMKDLYGEAQVNYGLLQHE